MGFRKKKFLIIEWYLFCLAFLFPRVFIFPLSLRCAFTHTHSTASVQCQSSRWWIRPGRCSLPDKDESMNKWNEKRLLLLKAVYLYSFQSLGAHLSHSFDSLVHHSKSIVDRPTDRPLLDGNLSGCCALLKKKKEEFSLRYLHGPAEMRYTSCWASDDADDSGEKREPPRKGQEERDCWIIHRTVWVERERAHLSQENLPGPTTTTSEKKKEEKWIPVTPI